jgi:ABC-type multidrug transport system fused ATPase/permease subunit
MQNINRFSKTKEAKQMWAVFISSIVLFVILIVVGEIHLIYLGTSGIGVRENYNLFIDFLLVVASLLLNSLLTVLISILASGISKHISFLQLWLFAYINDGVKEKIRPNPSFHGFLASPLTAFAFDIHDEESFRYAKNAVAKFKLCNLLAYDALAIIFLLVSIIVGHHLFAGMLFFIMSLAAVFMAINQSFPLRKKPENFATAYIRSKNDDVYSLLLIGDSLTFVTKYQYDPERVRDYYNFRICSHLADPTTNPDDTLSMLFAVSVFDDYTRNERTDYPRIIKDYMEYYASSMDRLFTVEAKNEQRLAFAELLFYLAINGRREKAIGEYNKKIAYLLPLGKMAQPSNGCLRYILFNEDYAAWLYDRKNMQPTSVPFIHKWFEMPYILDASGTAAIHKLVWEKSPDA